MKRDEFLTTLGIGLAAVCSGCLGACSSGDDAPATPQITPPTNVNATIDLNTDLKNPGDSKAVSNILVVRLATGNIPASFTAVQQACTHEGFPIAYSATQGKFVCPNHGSQFSTSGAVQLGPATTALKKYTITISGSTLTITG